MNRKSQDISEHKYLFHNGRDYRSYEIFGAHKTGRGWRFRVWAPNAKAVSVVGDFNEWNIDSNPMKTLKDDSSIWELTCRDAKEGDYYKYAIETDDGRILYKADPYAFESESVYNEGSQRASRLFDLSRKYAWKDNEWLKKRNSENHYESPVNIYEVHLGSWKYNADGTKMTYRQIARKLIPYVKSMGYTHIEMLPVMEHPYDGSWGYQITGYYSVTSRYGTPDDFRYLVDKAHEAGLGVILDWVPAHFPKDDYGLIEFDGHPLYEYSDPLKMEHKGWGTRSFDFGRPEVVSFLISNAFFYCEQFHADGLRVDAVAAMLYLNYDRQDGEWRPNEDGGPENKEAIAFLQHLNRDVLTTFPGVMMIAEESTAWPGVTMPPSLGGLGFNFKWNMGWMNDVLEYFGTDPLFRGGIHNKLTFAITYAYSENFILPISHDEIVHGKKSLLDKMPGEYDDKFAQLRAFYAYMFTHPGKKLTFMGDEFGQFIEWDEKRELDWMLLDYEKHRKLKAYVKALNHYYSETPALWNWDDSFDGFRWIDADNAQDNVYTYYRISKEEPEKITVVVLNLSGRSFPKYDIGIPDADAYTAMIDTEQKRFGGTGTRRKKNYPVKKGKRNGYDQYITISLPRLSALILEKR